MFAAAKLSHFYALELLDAGNAREAAGRAWAAAKLATDALILAKTGKGPANPVDTAERLLALARASEDAEALVGRYFTYSGYLYHICHRAGRLGPDAVRRIRDVEGYIEDAELLSGTKRGGLISGG